MELQLYGSIPRLPFATLIPRPSPGLTFFHWQNTGAAIQVISTHRKSSPSQSRITHLNVFNTAVVLTMRLYAMWKNNKYIVALLISLIAVESTVIGVVFGMTTKTVGSSSLLLLQHVYPQLVYTQRQTILHKTSLFARMATSRGAHGQHFTTPVSS